MRILLCIHHHLDANAGAPGVTLQLGAAYEALGHDVSFLSFDDLPAQLGPRAAEFLFPELAAVLLRRRARDVDILDATTGDAWLWRRVASRSTRPLLVTRSHGLEHVYWRSAVEETQEEGGSLPLRSRLYHGG